MARGTHDGSAGETSGNMVGNGAADGGCAVPGGRMATHAVCRVEGVIVVDVARRAGSRRWRHMRAD